MRRLSPRRYITLLLLSLFAMAAVSAPVFAQAAVSPAANIASRLGSVDNPIVNVYDYTQANDPEGLLGLPGAYTSKAYFRDYSGVEGLVEVFSNSTDALSRKAMLDQAGAGPAVVVGPVVLRVFGGTYAQQDAYTQRLRSLLRAG